MHTKGPWKYNDALADSGDKSTNEYGDSTTLYEPVCIIPHDDITEEGYEEVKANSKLIAAAPELLDSAEAMLNALRNIRDTKPEQWDAIVTPRLCGAWDSVKAAIAKAKG